MEKNKEYDQQIVNKIARLIKPEYFESAGLELMIKADNSNSIRITIENNPWRNGVIKGNSFFANIKSGGKTQYINVKDIFAYNFSEIGIESTANTTERKSEYIRINLHTFIKYLDNPSEKFIDLINKMFLRNILFQEFGCCSKYEECEKAGKCLHSDQLYATACHQRVQACPLLQQFLFV